MIKYKAVLFNVYALLFVLILLTPTLVRAYNYRQSAYVSSFYLCNKLVNKNNTIQPEIILNALIAENPKEAAYVVIDFIGNKGVHNLEIEILDTNGRPYSTVIKLDPVTVNDDGGFFRVSPHIAGKFPQGGVFFKILDTLDSGSKTTIGMFGVMTVK